MKKSPTSYFDQKFSRQDNNFHQMQAVMRKQLESRVDAYNLSCFSDYLGDAHLFCSERCLEQSSGSEGTIRPVEELCAKNCAKKTLNSYQLYVKMEEKISEGIVKDWKLDDIISEKKQ